MAQEQAYKAAHARAVRQQVSHHIRAPDTALNHGTAAATEAAATEAKQQLQKQSICQSTN